MSITMSTDSQIFNATLLSDRDIADLAISQSMISPFHEKQVRRNTGVRHPYSVISYGTSSFGYDCCLSIEEFKAFSPINASEIDPKNFNKRCLIDVELQESDNGSRYWLLPPLTYALGVTVETFTMPKHVTGIAVGKSTLARSGLIVNVTPLEAGWTGRLVVELFNAANLPLRVYAEEGICQILFFAGRSACQTSYDQRQGKYMNQVDLTLSKV